MHFAAKESCELLSFEKEEAGTWGFQIFILWSALMLQTFLPTLVSARTGPL